MEVYSHNHLLAAQERVEDELASSQGDGGVVVGHVVDDSLGVGEENWLMERKGDFWVVWPAAWSMMD
jgi:hypothetical protein